MRNIMRSAIIAATLCVISSTAIANPTIGVVSGVVTSIYDPGGFAPSTVHLGDSVSASFSYGTVASSFDPDVQTRRFNFDSGEFSFQVSIGGLNWSVTSGPGYVNLEDNQPTRQRDQYYVSTSNISGSPATFPAAIASSYLALGIYDWTSPQTLISGLSLPQVTSDIDISAATQTQGVISSFGFSGPTNSWTINYSVESFSLSTESVPEPTSLALLTFGLAGLGFSRRRKQKVA